MKSNNQTLDHTSTLKAMVFVKSLLRVITSVKLQSFRALQTYAHHKQFLQEQHELQSINEKVIIE